MAPSGETIGAAQALSFRATGSPPVIGIRRILPVAQRVNVLGQVRLFDKRAGGTFSEKCEIRQDVTAVGQTTGITWQGTATFKDDFVITDNCNFAFSNRGKVHLISRGSAVNTIVTFDDFVRMQDGLMTDDQHVVSFDCRGAGNQ